MLMTVFKLQLFLYFCNRLKNSEVTNVDHIIDSVSPNTILHYLQKLRRDDLEKVWKRAFFHACTWKKEQKESKSGGRGSSSQEDDDTKRIRWPLGVIVEMFMGKDGVSRVPKVRTSNGILKRPVQRIYPSELRTLADENIPRVKRSI